ncbi:MAG: hypothetical protein DRJ65_15705 [Acidobacteria bacterium]|nr:MAG: hypothetical protein DRJ65_15705 [Acidobacteriota bacterium]
MSGCRYETDVVTAARDGSWTEALRDHAASCLGCAETALVVAALTQDVEALALDDTPLPDPKIIWIRSRLKLRQERSFQATRVITWVQRLTIVCVAAVAIFFGPGLRELISGLRTLLPTAALADLPLLISGPSAVLGLTFVVMALMALWNERSAVS